ncbi:MAG: hypothetical protein IPG50_23930 [Myxococcales bacterium]|nr:hypothetical protein [Myxococcales bacterium]
MRASFALVLACSLGVLSSITSGTAFATPKKKPVEAAETSAGETKAAQKRDDRSHARRFESAIRAASKATGLYVRGDTASRKDYDALLDAAVVHGLDTIVLDAKDYDGTLTYRSQVALAKETGATNQAPIEDFSAAIKKAQAKGLRVAVRVSCFEDEFMTKARPSMSVMSKAGRPYPLGWLDPSNAAVQGYLVDLVREAIALGADEIQLDYVRYPVLAIKNADFHLDERGLTKTTVIRDFVRKVHQVTMAHDVPLSLDVFGVIAFGKRDDIERLGQDPVLLASECEVLSPMVYPSHYHAGFYGFEEPGAHPELVGIAMAGLTKQLDAVKGRRAVLRPWLQAMPWKSSTFSPGYIVQEIRSSDEHGGSGFLLWNPGQSYKQSFAALRAMRKADGKASANAARP